MCSCKCHTGFCQASTQPMVMPGMGMHSCTCHAGFNTAKVLSRKMVKLYKLASEQLSQQEHYDFGMRALKSVLATAGALKRASPGQPSGSVDCLPQCDRQWLAARKRLSLQQSQDAASNTVHSCCS